MLTAMSTARLRVDAIQDGDICERVEARHEVQNVWMREMEVRHAIFKSLTLLQAEGSLACAAAATVPILSVLDMMIFSSSSMLASLKS